MQYGHFDNEHREYVIDRVDLPASWTNYLGIKDMAAVVNHTAGGYLFYKTPEYHRITRFRPNGVPMDRPGQYLYLRDDESGDYWSISWQPVGKPLDQAKYTCRHGLSYSVYECDYSGIHASQTLVIPKEDPVELWDAVIRNVSENTRSLSIFSYLEFSYHHIAMDNQNFQMSLYAAGSSYADGIIEEDLFYEQYGFQYFTANFDPDDYDCVRDDFIGPYRTETNPLAVERGFCSRNEEKGGNHCGVLKKTVTLQPGEEIRLIFMLGEGNREAGAAMREKYADPKTVDQVYSDLRDYWNRKLSKLQIHTPNPDMDTMINTWNLYQAEINIMFSRFASFIEVGGRTGLGYRDTAQDSMTVPHSNPEKCRQRIEELMNGLVSRGYGLHLFDPAWFREDEEQKPFDSPTVIPHPKGSDMIHGLEDACSDDALWLIPSVIEYIKETGDESFADKVIGYADGGEGTVYEHMMKILNFSAEEVGVHGICKGLRADWNDCLNLGGGESALVTFLHMRALRSFLELAERREDAAAVETYTKMLQQDQEVSDRELWDENWFIRGVTKNGKKIGTHEDSEGKIHLESNAWAVLSGAASDEQGRKALDSVAEYLETPYGIMLNGPAYTKPDEDIGFVTRVYPGLKENASIFSHPNPWVWAAECVLGRGDRAMRFYNELCPAAQNDQIEVRKSEPYSYCQFISGRDHTTFGQAHHPFMTGTGGWAYFAATGYMLGIRPEFDHLVIDPCIPTDWEQFEAVREWRGAVYRISVRNPEHVSKGVKEIFVDGEAVSRIPSFPAHSSHDIQVIMGASL